MQWIDSELREHVCDLQSRRYALQKYMSVCKDLKHPINHDPIPALLLILSIAAITHFILIVRCRAREVMIGRRLVVLPPQSEIRRIDQQDNTMH